MATSTTFSTTFLGDWTLIADGASIAACGIQVEPGGVGIALAISATEPTADTDEYMVLQQGQETSVVFDLNATDKVYARSQNATRKGKVRGYQVTR